MKRLLVSVPAAKIGVVGVLRTVAVFYPVGRFLRASRGHIDADHGLRADIPAVLHIFRRAELMAEPLAPDQIAHLFAPLHRADVILPMVDADDGTAGEAQDGRAQLPAFFQHVLTDTLFVGQRMPGIADAIQNTVLDVLNEVAEDFFVDDGSRSGSEADICIHGHISVRSGRRAVPSDPSPYS